MREEEMAIAIVALVFGLPMLGIVMNIVVNGFVKAICHWRDVSLKIHLADRGMSAFEIEQIVQAGRKDKKRGDNKRSAQRTNPAVAHEEGKPPKADYALRY